MKNKIEKNNHVLEDIEALIDDLHNITYESAEQVSKAILGTGPRVSARAYRLHVPAFVARSGYNNHKAPSGWASAMSASDFRQQRIETQERILRGGPVKKPPTINPPTQVERLEQRVATLEAALQKAGIAA